MEIELISRSISGAMRSEPTGHSHRYYNEQIDVQELVNLQSPRPVGPFLNETHLEVAQRRSERIQQSDGGELNQRVQCPVESRLDTVQDVMR
jgi:hypothetical protein